MEPRTLQEMIDALKVTGVPTVLPLTRERFMEHARGMAARGYRFGEPEVRLLKSYLSTASGLLVCGDVGVGKTFFFKALGIPVLSMQLACEHSLAELSAALASHRDDDALIDDIGAEGEFNHYGTKIDILSVIVDERLQSSARTHFTSNLSIDDILARYGARTFDRIKELAKLVKLQGASKRSADGARIEPEDFFLPRLWKACSERCSLYDESSRRCTKRVLREPSAVERCPYF